ncbi:MAG: VanZ family protein [Pyrinomonadaceae bacterium]
MTSNFSTARAPGNRLWRYGPVVIWMAFIFVASTSALSASNTSGLSRRLLQSFFSAPMDEEQFAFWHFLIRKFSHFAEYAVLALLLARAFATSSLIVLRRRYARAALLLVAAYALLDEFHQSFVPGRGASLYDSLIDIAGGAFALAFLSLFCALRKARAQGAKR